MLFLLETFDVLGGNFNHIKSNGFREGSALSDGNNISDFNTLEAWAKMSRNVLVSFFISVVFFKEMKVISSDNNSSMHFVGRNDSSENSTSNANVSGKWTFLINVLSFNGFSGRFVT